MNIKHLQKSYNISLKEGISFTSIDDNDSTNFLEMFSERVNSWENLKEKTTHGGLSPETSFVLSHTSRTFIKLFKCFIIEVKQNMSYQKNSQHNLEGRFRQ